MREGGDQHPLVEVQAHIEVAEMMNEGKAAWSVLKESHVGEKAIERNFRSDYDCRVHGSGPSTPILFRPCGSWEEKKAGSSDRRPRDLSSQTSAFRRPSWLYDLFLFHIFFP